MSTSEPTPLDALLDHIKRSRGFDFSGYKRASLERRIAKRLEALGCEDYAAYLDYLEVHQDEFERLFNTILINVTAFFRDRDAWDHLRDDVLPGLLESRPGEAPIRVWCAGCASGPEAYSVAMVLHGLLGEAAYRERVKIYATDVDEEALAEARCATYTNKQVEAIPADLRERYFERADARVAFRKDLRRTVIFGRNDLVQDAPISKVDLLLCRNTLMYFTADAQAQILSRFHFALRDDGVLFLGKAEMLLTHGEIFTPVDVNRRIFSKAAGTTTARTRARPQQIGQAHVASDDGAALREAAFDAGSVPQIVLDAEGVLAVANETACSLFGLQPRDVGRLLQDLEISYRPVELRAHLDEASAHRQRRLLRGVPFSPGGKGPERRLDVQITPLLAGDALLGTEITFIDVSDSHRMQEQLRQSKEELERAYEELQSTVEELETTNEELQSTNEELETTNEELRLRTIEIHEANDYFDAILASMGVGVAVLDHDVRIRFWNSHAEGLWGLRGDEVIGQRLLDLDIGLPVAKLKKPIHAAVLEQEGSEIELDATNRRGRSIRCRVSVMPLGVNGAAQSGTILLMASDELSR